MNMRECIVGINNDKYNKIKLIIYIKKSKKRTQKVKLPECLRPEEPLGHAQKKEARNPGAKKDARRSVFRPPRLRRRHTLTGSGKYLPSKK